ncbi:MAG: radical SAM protein, partial [Deltaproteobacteria bacterium]|nr:radical SAM protein [Deltaproteobacteria bacterium]
YEYVFDTGKLARDAGIKNVFVSNGYIKKDPLINLCKVIDAANIDLKSLDDAIYLKLNAGKLEPILTSLKTLKDEGVWLEITNLVIPSWTDDLEMIRKMCGWLAENNFDDTPLHFSRFHPQHKLQRLPATPVNTLVKAKDIAQAEGLKFVYIGNVPGTNATDTICPQCHNKLVDRSGYSIADIQITNGKCYHCQEEIAGRWN